MIPNLSTADKATLSPSGRILLSLLQRGPRTWTDLLDAGLDRGAVLAGVGELALSGHYRVRVGPLLVEVEAGPDGEEVPAS